MKDGLPTTQTSGRAWAWKDSVLWIPFVSLIFASVLRSLPTSYIVCSESRSIYTVDENRPRVECISIRGSRIVDVGNLADLKPRYLWSISGFLPTWVLDSVGLRLITVDKGAVVVPGLADAHAHIIENGHAMQLPLAGSGSIQEVRERITNYIISHPDVRNNNSRWIEGLGWDQTRWTGANFPTAADLDSDPLLNGRLISLSRIDGHARWVSQAVLDLMPNLPEAVDGGLILRHADGKPTGIFIDKAMDLIPIPAWADQQVAKYYDFTIKKALSYGLTSIHDADTLLEHIDFFKKMADAGKVPVRLYLMGRGSDYWGDKIVPLHHYGKHRRLDFRSVKLYADGALGSWGAALLEPYSDRPETTGLLVQSEDTLRNLVYRFWRDGWQTGVHCIGDRANRVVLDIYEEILDQRGGNVSHWRPRIEHAQIFAPDDLVRIGKLGVIASVQPTHATSDMWYAEARLGAQRIKGSYAYQTLLQASPTSVLPLGSDFPVESVNPLLGFYAAITRLSIDGSSPHGSEGWFADQKLTREQALKGMTLDAAYAAFSESEIGSLTPGKKADFVILDRDIMTVPPKDILDAKVMATVVDGIVQYGKL